MVNPIIGVFTFDELLATAAAEADRHGGTKVVHWHIEKIVENGVAWYVARDESGNEVARAATEVDCLSLARRAAWYLELVAFVEIRDEGAPC